MTRNQEIAGTILAQLGGNRFRAMTGARDFLAIEGGLAFALPKFSGVKINRVRVTLTAGDDYTVEFMAARAGKMTPVSSVEGVYGDQLASVFKSATGLETSMGRAN